MHSPKSDKFLPNSNFLDRMLMHSPRSDKFRQNNNFQIGCLCTPPKVISSFRTLVFGQDAYPLPRSDKLCPNKQLRWMVIQTNFPKVYIIYIFKRNIFLGYKYSMAWEQVSHLYPLIYMLLFLQETAPYKVPPSSVRASHHLRSWCWSLPYAAPNHQFGNSWV